MFKFQSAFSVTIVNLYIYVIHKFLVDLVSNRSSIFSHFCLPRSHFY